MAKKNSSDPLVLFAQTHGGHLKLIPRKKHGQSYLYYYMSNGAAAHKHFPAGTPPETIMNFIIEVQANNFTAKHGYEPLYLRAKRKQEVFTLPQMLDWYIRVRLQEKVPRNDPNHARLLESAQRTLESYEYSFNLLLTFAEEKKGGKDFPAEKVTIAFLEEFKRWLLQRDGGRGGNRLNSVILSLERICGMFRKAAYEKKIPEYPFAGYKIPQRELARKRGVLTWEEMKAIGESEYLQKRPELWWAWQIARFTAIRGQDIRRLEWENFDWEKCEFDIWMAKVRRRVCLPFHPKLKKYRDKYWKAKGWKNPTGKMFDFTMRELNHKFRYAIFLEKGKDSTSWGSHTLRHSLATFLDKEVSWPIDYVGMFLSHSDGNITLRYTHERVERLRDMLLKLPFS